MPWWILIVDFLQMSDFLALDSTFGENVEKYAVRPMSGQVSKHQEANVLQFYSLSLYWFFFVCVFGSLCSYLCLYLWMSGRQPIAKDWNMVPEI